METKYVRYSIRNRIINFQVGKLLDYLERVQRWELEHKIKKNGFITIKSHKGHRIKIKGGFVTYYQKLPNDLPGIFPYIDRMQTHLFMASYESFISSTNK